MGRCEVGVDGNDLVLLGHVVKEGAGLDGVTSLAGVGEVVRLGYYTKSTTVGYKTSKTDLRSWLKATEAPGARMV